MLESATAKNDLPLETSIPHGAVSLESILCTEELRRRPWRPPNYEKENRALVALAGALVESPSMARDGRPTSGRDEGDWNRPPLRKNTSTKAAAACRCWSVPRASREGRMRA
jgi:hypothetical protein